MFKGIKNIIRNVYISVNNKKYIFNLITFNRGPRSQYEYKFIT